MSDFVVTLNDKKKTVSISGNSHILIDDQKIEYELILLNSHTYLLKINDQFFEISVDKTGNGKYSLLIDGNQYETIIRTALQEKVSELLQQKNTIHSKTEVRAPMPGMILKIKKDINDKVKQGETILILEAMKMENDLRSPRSGILSEIMTKEGSAVEKGTVLFTIK
jgi:biotin carboxyl carrier protein